MVAQDFREALDLRREKQEVEGFGAYASIFWIFFASLRRHKGRPLGYATKAFQLDQHDVVSVA